MPLRVCDHDAVLALGDRPVEHRREVIEDVEQQPHARGQRAELGLEADQTARRDHVVEPHPALAVGLHAGELPAAAAERGHHGTLARVLDVDREDLVRLVEHAVDLLGDDPRS